MASYPTNVVWVVDDPEIGRTAYRRKHLAESHRDVRAADGIPVAVQRLEISDQVRVRRSADA